MTEFWQIARNFLIATLLAWLGFSIAPADKPETPDDDQSSLALFR